MTVDHIIRVAFARDEDDAMELHPKTILLPTLSRLNKTSEMILEFNFLGDEYSALKKARGHICSFGLTLPRQPKNRPIPRRAAFRALVKTIEFGLGTDSTDIPITFNVVIAIDGAIFWY